MKKATELLLQDDEFYRNWSGVLKSRILMSKEKEGESAILAQQLEEFLLWSSEAGYKIDAEFLENVLRCAAANILQQDDLDTFSRFMRTIRLSVSLIAFDKNQKRIGSNIFDENLLKKIFETLKNFYLVSTNMRMKIALDEPFVGQVHLACLQLLEVSHFYDIDGIDNDVALFVGQLLDFAVSEAHAKSAVNIVGSLLLMEGVVFREILNQLLMSNLELVPSSAAKRECLAAVFHKYISSGAHHWIAKDAEILRTFLLDKESSLVRKYALACMELLFCKGNDGAMQRTLLTNGRNYDDDKTLIWKDFLLLLRSLEEAQFHLVMPVLQTKFDVLNNYTRRRMRKEDTATANDVDFTVNWLAVVLYRCFSHGNGWIRLFAVEKFLTLDVAESLNVCNLAVFFEKLTDFDIYWRLFDSERIEFFMDNLKTFLGALLNLGKAPLLADLLRVVGAKIWVPSALFYLTEALSQLAIEWTVEVSADQGQIVHLFRLAFYNVSLSRHIFIRTAILENLLNFMTKVVEFRGIGDVFQLLPAILTYFPDYLLNVDALSGLFEKTDGNADVVVSAISPAKLAERNYAKGVRILVETYKRTGKLILEPMAKAMNVDSNVELFLASFEAYDKFLISHQVVLELEHMKNVQDSVVGKLNFCGLELLDSIYFPLLEHVFYQNKESLHNFLIFELGILNSVVSPKPDESDLLRRIVAVKVVARLIQVDEQYGNESSFAWPLSHLLLEQLLEFWSSIDWRGATMTSLRMELVEPLFSYNNVFLYGSINQNFSAFMKSEFISNFWQLVDFVAKRLDTQAEILQKCLDKLGTDVQSAGIFPEHVRPMLALLQTLLSLQLKKVGNLDETVCEFMNSVWKFSLAEGKKRDSYLVGLKDFLDTFCIILFSNSYGDLLISVASFFEILEFLLKEAEGSTSVIEVTANCLNSALENCLKTGVFNRHAELFEILVSLALFGPIPKKDESVARHVCEWILKKDGHWLSAVNSRHNSAKQARLWAIGSLCRLVEYSSEADKVMEMHDGHSSLVRRDKDTAEQVLNICLHRLEKLRRGDKRSSCRYLSMNHRLKSRIFQLILLLVGRTKRGGYIRHRLVDMCTAELNENGRQNSVRVLAEICLLKLAFENDAIFNGFVGNSEPCATAINGVKKDSRLWIVHKLFQQMVNGKACSNSSELRDKLEVLLDELLSSCCSQNFALRASSLASVRIILEKCPQALQMVYGSSYSTTPLRKMVCSKDGAGNSEKIIASLKADFYFGHFDAINDFSFDALFHLIPKRTVLPDDEWLILKEHDKDKFAQVVGNISRIVPLSCRACLFDKPSFFEKSSRKPAEGEGDWNTPLTYKNEADEITDFQRKIVISAGKSRGQQQDSSEVGEASTVPEAQLIVVASLLDKPPNIGGLCRTCEAFGVSELVVNDESVVNSLDFKSLSLSSERWQNISEVKAYKVARYLREKKEEGFCVVAAEQATSSVPLGRLSFPPKCVLLLGHEKLGIPCDLLQHVDKTVEIAQVGYTRSLNVHVSGALIVFDFFKQWTSKK